jgi:hypothetical protein
VASPAAALACSVCTGQDNDTVNAAFLAGTIFLSVLPLLWIGGVAWFLVRRARQLRDAPARSRA